MISKEIIKGTTVELLRQAVTRLPADVKKALEDAYNREEDEVPRSQLKAILDNVALAEENSLPMCQDTGVPIFFVNVGNVETGNIQEAIVEGVLEGTEVIPLRPNAVHPITRKNPGNNVGERMPYVNYRFTDNDYLEIGVMPKGAGSENVSGLAMLTSAAGIKGIKQFVLDVLLKAGSKPCPPTILGVGIGGSADISMKLGKESLLRPLDQRHPEADIAELEEMLYTSLNEMGIGPMGLGGKTTILGVNIEYAACHTASLPVAVNVQCWAARRAACRIYPDGRVEYTTHGGD
ncbi:MAG: fumarate hydratase [Methanobacteriota archaeon]|nr:MAG: fumarate hydratase [Euryarchaeota archaeon]